MERLVESKTVNIGYAPDGIKGTDISPSLGAVDDSLIYFLPSHLVQDDTIA